MHNYQFKLSGRLPLLQIPAYGRWVRKKIFCLQ